MTVMATVSVFNVQSYKNCRRLIFCLAATGLRSRLKITLFKQIKKAVRSAQHDAISGANLQSEGGKKGKKNERSVCGAALVVLKMTTCELGRKEKNKKRQKEKSPQLLWGSTECPQLTTCGLCRHLYIHIHTYIDIHTHTHICICALVKH